MKAAYTIIALLVAISAVLNLVMIFHYGQAQVSRWQLLSSDLLALALCLSLIFQKATP